MNHLPLNGQLKVNLTGYEKEISCALIGHSRIQLQRQAQNSGLLNFTHGFLL